MACCTKNLQLPREPWLAPERLFWLLSFHGFHRRVEPFSENCQIRNLYSRWHSSLCSLEKKQQHSQSHSPKFSCIKLKTELLVKFVNSFWTRKETTLTSDENKRTEHPKRRQPTPRTVDIHAAFPISLFSAVSEGCQRETRVWCVLWWSLMLVSWTWVRVIHVKTSAWCALPSLLPHSVCRLFAICLVNTSSTCISSIQEFSQHLEGNSHS